MISNFERSVTFQRHSNDLNDISHLFFAVLSNRLTCRNTYTIMRILIDNIRKTELLIKYRAGILKIIIHYYALFFF